MVISETCAIMHSNQPNPFNVGDIVRYNCTDPYWGFEAGDKGIVEEITGHYIMVLSPSGSSCSYASRWELSVPLKLNVEDWL